MTYEGALVTIYIFSLNNILSELNKETGLSQVGLRCCHQSEKSCFVHYFWHGTQILILQYP